MGNQLATPNTTKVTESGTEEDYNWVTSRMPGYRDKMEDFVISHAFINKMKLFMVIDGYGGTKCARRTATEYPRYLANSIQETGIDLQNEGQVQDLLTTSIQKFDSELRTDPMLAKSGCCVSGILIAPKTIYIINLGNSGTILVRNDRTSISTTAHLPSNPGEKSRIEAAGGKVENRRLDGRLKVSRAIGHFALKESEKHKLSSKPDVKVIPRKAEEHSYVVMFTDGVTAAMSKDELIYYIDQRLPCKASLDHLAEEILDYCCHKKSKDNISFGMIHFHGSSIQPEEDRIKSEREYEDTLRQMVREYVSSTMAMRFPTESNCFERLQLENKDFFEKNDKFHGLGSVLRKQFIYDEFKKQMDLHLQDRENVRRKKSRNNGNGQGKEE